MFYPPKNKFAPSYLDATPRNGIILTYFGAHLHLSITTAAATAVINFLCYEVPQRPKQRKFAGIPLKNSMPNDTCVGLAITILTATKSSSHRSHSTFLFIEQTNHDLHLHPLSSVTDNDSGINDNKGDNERSKGIDNENPTLKKSGEGMIQDQLLGWGTIVSRSLRRGTIKEQ